MITLAMFDQQLQENKKEISFVGLFLAKLQGFDQLSSCQIWKAHGERKKKLIIDAEKCNTKAKTPKLR